MAFDQTDRYTNLDLREDELIAGGRHVLVAYHMKPKPGYGDYLATSAHFAAESSTGTNVEISTTDEHTLSGDALNVILITDEDRDYDASAPGASLTYNSVLSALDAKKALLNVVVNADLEDGSNLDSLGIDADGNAYRADGSGGYNSFTGGHVQSA